MNRVVYQQAMLFHKSRLHSACNAKFHAKIVVCISMILFAYFIGYRSGHSWKRRL